MSLCDHVTAGHTYGDRLAIFMKHPQELVDKARKTVLDRLDRLIELNAPETIIAYQQQSVIRSQSKQRKMILHEQAEKIDTWFKMPLWERIWQAGSAMKHWGEMRLIELSKEYKATNDYVALLEKLDKEGVKWPYTGHLGAYYDEDDEWYYPDDISESLERREERIDEIGEARACIATGDMVKRMVRLYKDTKAGHDTGLRPDRIEHPLHAAVFVLGLMRGAYVKANHMEGFPSNWDIQSSRFQDMDLGLLDSDDMLVEMLEHEIHVEHIRQSRLNPEEALLKAIFGDEPE